MGWRRKGGVEGGRAVQKKRGWMADTVDITRPSAAFPSTCRTPNLNPPQISTFVETAREHSKFLLVVHSPSAARSAPARVLVALRSQCAAWGWAANGSGANYTSVATLAFSEVYSVPIPAH
eukprot:TRINITY_DN6315_c0_g1_i2.p2 TRINITY_DN6315_c0_g1~~TRINITY_DN6315_c0_g1_i2.p2  ORF type:complete len:121 (+),score=1.27 TRINITY_DN6315_c0_g1_i2:220-582(+)